MVPQSKVLFDKLKLLPQLTEEIYRTVWYLVIDLLKMLGTIKDPTLFLLLSSVGILLFGSIGYGIYTTVGPSSYKLRDTIKEHARMHELGIAHGHNHHNHNEAEHIH